MQPLASVPARNGLAAAVSCCLSVGGAGALGVVLFSALAAPAWAGCDNTAPTTGQTVTCTATVPNPQPTSVVSSPGSNTITVNVQSGASIGVPANGAIALEGGSGHRIDNSGSLVSTTGAGIIASGATTVINRGTITGGTAGIVLGPSSDRLEMLGGNITGGVLQGAGTDAVLFSAGTLDRINQGEGEDSLEISGGTVTGEIDQSRDPDHFLMTGGTVGSLVQGDGFDTFRMTDGHIVGGFDDGDSAEMTGGRIGRVNMKLDDNVFVMSGGSIDGNLVTGLGRDFVALNNGDIGGNISVSGGNDRVSIAGGTVGGNVLTSVGGDSFDWTFGGVIRGFIDMGEGGDTADLVGLEDPELDAFIRLDGGLDNDVLSIGSGTRFNSRVSRLVNWEQVFITADALLTIDEPFVLGDAGSGSGQLHNFGVLVGKDQGRIEATAPGALVDVTNGAVFDLATGSTPGTAFTIVGNYAGQGSAVLLLQTVLGDDGSVSDRLVIDRGVGSGFTDIHVFNAGGTGGKTVADGIMLVQALNGATTSDGSFALNGGSVSAGAYEYYLFKGGVSAGTGDNWYLRSTIVPGPVPAPVVVVPEPPPPVPGVPPEPAPLPVPAPSPLLTPPTPEARPAQMAVIPIYRIETPAYAVIPPIMREASMASLGTFHERQGEQRMLRGEGSFRSAWGRMIGQSHEQSWAGDAQPGFDGDFLGMQAGADLYAHAADSRNQVGVFVGRTRAQGNVTGFALGWENVAVGRSRLDDKHVGLYYTWVGSANGYLDAVLMRSRYDGHSVSTRGIGVDIKGDGTTASLEVGKPLLRFGSSAWQLEPQLQMIWQQTAIDDTSDSFAVLRMDNDDSWTARVGLRLSGDYTLADNGWQPYAKLNYWQAVSGEDRIDIGGDPLTSEQAYRALEIGVGVIARYNANVSAFAVADYTRDLDSHRLKERRVLEGNIGLRVDF